MVKIRVPSRVVSLSFIYPHDCKSVYIHAAWNFLVACCITMRACAYTDEHARARVYVWHVLWMWRRVHTCLQWNLRLTGYGHACACGGGIYALMLRVRALYAYIATCICVYSIVQVYLLSLLYNRVLCRGRHPADFVCISHVWCVFMKACLLVYIFLARSVAFLLVVERVCEEILGEEDPPYSIIYEKTFAEFRPLSSPVLPLWSPFYPVFFLSLFSPPLPLFSLSVALSFFCSLARF